MEIEDKLSRELDIPIFHNDQHAIAILVTATYHKKSMDRFKNSCCRCRSNWIFKIRLLINFNPDDIILTNTKGIIYDGRPDLNSVVSKMVKITNKHKIKGTLADALYGEDAFIWVSAANIITSKVIEGMNKDAIVFALTILILEIMPEDVFKGDTRIFPTGRPDFLNHINNIAFYPGIFRGA